MDKVEVFFRGAFGSGSEAVASPTDLEIIRAIIQRAGGQMDHAQDETQSEREKRYTTTAIHEQDYREMQRSEVGIFVINDHDTGIGGQISDMLSMGKPVLCLVGHWAPKIPPYIAGKGGSRHCPTKLVCAQYHDLLDDEKTIASFLAEHKKHRH